MDRILLLPDDFAAYAWEVESKGVFWDAAVRVDGHSFRVTFYDPVRLSQDVREEIAAGRPFSMARMLVVERVTSSNMKSAIQAAPSELFE